MTAGTAAQNVQSQVELLRYVNFRIRVAVGCVFAVILLFAPTLGTWFSDHRGAGSSPASGLIDHWNFWLVMSGGLGGGPARLPDGDPAGFAIGGLEQGLAWLVLVVLAFSVLALLRTAATGGWGAALAAAIGVTVAFAVEMVLRFAGDADHRGNSGPHSYDTGAGMALAQWLAVAVVIWALYVMQTARSEFRDFERAT
jgi:multisubunit Na+/H+ antiporter MnhB subunit